MLDAVDIRTDWTEQRALENRMEKKERKESRIVRVYGEAQTPLTRVLAPSEVTKEKKRNCGWGMRDSIRFN